LLRRATRRGTHPAYNNDEQTRRKTPTHANKKQERERHVKEQTRIEGTETQGESDIEGKTAGQKGETA